MARLDEFDRKLHPWLRTVENGDQVVNAVRADGSARVACAIQSDTEGVKTAPIYAELTQQVTSLPRWTEQVETSVSKFAKRPKLSECKPADESYVNVFIEFFPEQQEASGAASKDMERVKQHLKSFRKADSSFGTESISRRNLLCATVPVTALDELKREPSIAFIHASDPLTLDRPDVTSVDPRKKPSSRAVGNARKNGRGEGVLIGIIDVGGFDFSHRDFLDENGETRFVAIWDQGGDFRSPPKGFSSGAEFRQKDLNAALKASRTSGLPPAPWIEKQSQLQPSSHGTHVASIAAGNSGVCPKSKIAGVLIHVPNQEDGIEQRRTTFSDTSSITRAVEYLLKIAEEEKLPISINISLGTNGGSHDGSSVVSRWLDAYLAQPGRAICVAAGNAGQERAQSEGDLGWIMGRIHTSGKIPARGLEVEIEWTVVGDGIEDWSENELEIWYSAQDRFAVALKPPGGSEWIEVKPREFVKNKRLASGVTISIYNELYHPTNGGNYIALYLSPNFDPDNFRGITKGIWKVRLIGEEVRDGRFDAWIERDDPMEVGRVGQRKMFRFPSFFTEKSNVDSHSITSLACGHRVIAVANLDEEKQLINVSRSQGPTRDGRFKPEIAAPGTNVLAANGFAEEDDPWISMSGTSMASPYVAGVIGLMLAANPDLTASQCLGILQRTSRPLAGASYQWVNDVGFGRIDPELALEEARLINTRVQLS